MHLGENCKRLRRARFDSGNQRHAHYQDHGREERIHANEKYGGRDIFSIFSKRIFATVQFTHLLQQMKQARSEYSFSTNKAHRVRQSYAERFSI